MARFDWRQGAPWWALPFLFVGYLAAAFGILLSILMDWWILQIAACLAFGVWMAIEGSYGWAVFAAIGAVAGIAGMMREDREHQATDEPPTTGH